jgi:phosphate transport system permease protein
MNYTITFWTLLTLSGIGFFVSKNKAQNLAKKGLLKTMTVYYGYMTFIWMLVPTLFIYICWIIFSEKVVFALLIERFSLFFANKSPLELGEFFLRLQGGDFNNINPQIVSLYNSYQNYSFILLNTVLLSSSLLLFFLSYKKISPKTRVRKILEKYVYYFLLLCTSIAIFTTVGIVLSVLFESIEFFKRVSIFEFMFGLEWSPQTAIREGQVGSSGSFGAIPLFVGTLLISFVAMLVATPLGLFSAIFLSQYANKRLRSVFKPILEVLAGVPTVVYGFFAIIAVAPFIRNMGEQIGLDVSSESALAAGIVMGIMIIPFISSISDDIITAVPRSLKDGSLALGATKSETIKKVLLPAALPGIAGGMLLAVSRAIGETMIVVMAAGLAANLTVNPLQAVTTITVQIVTLLTGDQEFDSSKTLAAFALGLGLLVVTLVLNIIALQIVNKYKQQYE